MTKIYLIIFSIFVNLANATNEQSTAHSAAKIRKSESMFSSKIEESKNYSYNTPGKKVEMEKSSEEPERLNIYTSKIKASNKYSSNLKNNVIKIPKKKIEMEKSPQKTNFILRQKIEELNKKFEELEKKQKFI
jgi:hypothetical protein